MMYKKLDRAWEKDRICPFLAHFPKDTMKGTDLEYTNPECYGRSKALITTCMVGIEQSQKFLLDAEGISGEEVEASAKAMSEAGLFRLPYDFVYVEVPFAFQSIERRCLVTKGRMLILAMESPREIQQEFPLMDTQFGSHVFFNLPEMDGVHYFRWLPGTVLHGSREAMFTQGHLRFGFDDRDMLAFTEIARAVKGAIATLIVLLQTKGVEKEHMPDHHVELIHRDKPENGYTIVRNYVSRDGSGRQIEARKRTRLHLRRGHVRTQRHGRGRKYSRQIWIEPTLVGYEEEGRIEHLYEVDGEKK